MKRSTLILISAGAALALVAAGTAAGAAIAGPVDGSGVIDGCWTNGAVNGTHVFVLQDAGTNCPKGTTAISWNQQGPAGPAGAAGNTVLNGGGPPGPSVGNTGDFYLDTTPGAPVLYGPKAQGNWPPGVSLVGLQGAPGPAGPGYVLTTTSGIAPPLTQDGTYYVDVRAELTNPSSTDPLIGFCTIFGIGPKASLFAGAFAVSPGRGPTYSFSGIVTVSGGASSANPLQLNLGCEDMTGAEVTPGAVTWWVSPVSTSS